MVGAAAIDGFDGMCADAHSAPGKGGPSGTDGAGAEQRGAVKKLYGAGSRTGADVGGKGNGLGRLGGVPVGGEGQRGGGADALGQRGRGARVRCRVARVHCGDGMTAGGERRSGKFGAIQNSGPSTSIP